jgi:drug/metabolite transporter (DMT)-like permease
VSPPPDSDNPMRGILLMLGAFVTFSLMDTLAKLLGDMGYPAVFVTWARLLVQVVVLVPFVLRHGGLDVLRTRHPRTQALRGIAMLGAGIFFVSGLHFLPLATMTSINFVGPFVVTLMSIVFLKEQVGRNRWTAIVVGFAGALVVIRPGTDSFNAAALFAVASATCWSVGMITTRLVQRDDATLTTLTLTALVGLAGASLIVPLFWRPLDLAAAACLLGMGLGGTLGQLLMIRALRFAAPSVLAPFAYSQIVWATLLGFALWGDFPDGWTWLGTAVIVASGLYVWYRERQLAAPRLRPPR